MSVKEIEITVYPDGRVDTDNASLYIGKSKKTMAMHRSNGTGPPFIKQGRIFYYLDDLDAWMKEGGKMMSTGQALRRKTNI